jgi:hypothetical protein
MKTAAPTPGRLPSKNWRTEIIQAFGTDPLSSAVNFNVGLGVVLCTQP